MWTHLLEIECLCLISFWSDRIKLLQCYHTECMHCQNGMVPAIIDASYTVMLGSSIGDKNYIANGERFRVNCPSKTCSQHPEPQNRSNLYSRCSEV